MTDENDGKKKENKPRFRGVFHAFAEIADALTTDTSRIFALFLLLPLTAIVAFVFAPQTPLVAGAILAVVLIAVCMTLYLLLLLRERRRSARKSSSLASRWGTIVLFSATSLLLGILLHQLGIFAKLVPGLYPQHAAVDAVYKFYTKLGGIFAAEEDEQQMHALQDFAKTMTPDFRKRNLPKGCAEVLSALESKPDDAQLRSKAIGYAKTYRDWFGRANGVFVDLIGSSTWQHLQQSDSRQVLHVLAIVRFSGRFTENTFPNSKMRVRDLSIALSDPESRQRLQLVRWLEEQFPSIDTAQVDAILGELYVTDLSEPNAFDLAQYRLGTEMLGSQSESTCRFGYEVSFVSIRLEMETSVANPQWQVAEIGRWGMKRVFTEASPPDSAFSSDQGTKIDGVPYHSQKTSSLCQSACLQMVAEYLSSPRGSYDQLKIRASLEALGDPLAHSVRIKWLAQEFGGYDWESRYVPSLPAAAQEIKKQLSEGVPVVMATRLTPSGHVIVVTGIWYNTIGEVVVRAHDPWGRFDFKMLRYDRQPGAGKDVEYPLGQLFVRNRTWIGDEGQREIASYIVGSEEWIPANSEQLKKGLVITDTASDWEFVTASRSDLQ